ncbi:endonuclease [Vibrio ishigakensis]|uniref:Endonuclease n=1 Tax=Vibrio ishigakensis TaxID=1481914 RepID=A0A0B8P5B0_9VIBR|nr:Z1 domain-containing protein [Vibrio ishigakensis]GAM58164.1 endonuclease [Vibrio ishigakensis]
MNNKIENFKKTVLPFIETKSTELVDGDIRDIVNNTSGFFKIMHGEEIYHNEIEEVIAYFESLFSQEMGEGTLFRNRDHIPWLDECKADINWYYWNRYEKHLINSGFSPKVAGKIDLVTNKILDNCQNPDDDGQWSRKGLVVGHVQSGKTANYTGLITKAADAGYKVIIVLAGILSALRAQTQERIDEGFIGRDSTRYLDANKNLKLVGVGLERSEQSKRFPVSLTTSEDFDTAAANSFKASIDGFKEPVVLVLKKNKSILNNVIKWFKNNNLNLDDVPMLLIDDEADHASINTNKEDDDPTAINSKIREIIGLFRKNTYVGYTATPFANIFIDPETTEEMEHDDLFPRDFILNLDAPSNYIGPDKIFGDNSELDIVREVVDCEEHIPMSHKKDFVPTELPISLMEAINCFVITKAIRLLRGQFGKNNSMLINVSRFTDVQSNLKILVFNYIKSLSNDILNHYAKEPDIAIRNKSIRQLKATFLKEYSDVEFVWAEVQSQLKASIAPLKVIEVNGSINAEPLDYDKERYPSGRTIIAVGGLSLSRGLTLEGLTVSYFMRNSQMYDTLQQQGRWFGYRPNFEDICRVYMAPEAISWYRHISAATNELRADFSRMEQARMSPLEFGLAVRAHPESLMVTARNKMRTGNKFTQSISLSGRLVQTEKLLATKKSVNENHALLRRFIKSVIGNTNVDANIKSPGVFVKDISNEDAVNFIQAFRNHPASMQSEPNAISDYIEKKYDLLDLLIVSPSKGKESLSLKLETRDGELNISAAKRTAVFNSIRKEIISSNSTFVSPNWESAGLTTNDIESLKKKKKSSNHANDDVSLSGRDYRTLRTKPLLIISVLDVKEKESKEEDSKKEDSQLQECIGSDGIVFWALSFPKLEDHEALLKENQVEYIVNTQYWKEIYSDYDLEEEYDD